MVEDKKKKIIYEINMLIELLSNDLPKTEIDNGWNEQAMKSWIKFFSKMKEDIANNVELKNKPEYISIVRGLDSYGIMNGNLFEKALTISNLTRELCEMQKGFIQKFIQKLKH